VLFVNAGVGKFAPLQAADEAHFDLMFNINVRGLYFVIKHAAPVIADGGAILLTGSVAGARGRAGMSVYSATKAAMRSFARTLAAEFAPRNIRVNIISPGPVETPVLGKLGLTPEQVEAWLEGSKKEIPLGRIGRAEEVAATALYLAADATFTTGGEIFVGGGLIDV
jgi:NAD(P)-dependent dehydrogenase (short-subunit alcohol dehydrogenase family)